MVFSCNDSACLLVNESRQVSVDGMHAVFRILREEMHACMHGDSIDWSFH